MYIIIAGGGLIGKGMAKRLVALNHDVIVVDQNSRVCEEIYAKYGAVTICGNATDLDTLENARVDKCEIAVAVMRNDSDNLAFALLAKHYKVPQVLVRMVNPSYEDVYKTVGVSNIARSTDLMIDQLMVNIESPELRKVIGLGNVEICIVNMPENALHHGLNISDLVTQRGFPGQITVTAIFSEEKQVFIVPKGDTPVYRKDRIFLCGSQKDIKSAAKVIQKEKPVS